MLNTIRFQCRSGKRLMPNYGRLEKVNKSMARLMAVWNERTHLKYLNRRVAYESKKEAQRNGAIEYRRRRTLEKREKVKHLFEEKMGSLPTESEEDMIQSLPLYTNEHDLNG